MSREFAVSAGNLTLIATNTALFVNPKAGPNFNIEFLRFWMSQSANATSAQQRVQLETQATTWPTLVAATPASLKRADPNVSIIIGSTNGGPATAGVNASTDGGGTQTVILEDNFNVLNGWLMVPTPAETIILPAGYTQGLGLRTAAGPSTLTNWAVGAHFREV